MPETFFTADLHLFHANILELEPVNRAFSSIDEMHQTIITNWNKDVRPSDTVFVLGDVMFHDRGLEILRQLNGTKKLVRGNHDEKFSNALFSECFSQVTCYRRIHHCLLSHIPVHPCQLSERFVANIHGHMHSKRVLTEGGNIDPRYINVSMEQWNMTPVAWSDIEPQVRILRELQQEQLARGD